MATRFCLNLQKISKGDEGGLRSKTLGVRPKQAWARLTLPYSQSKGQPRNLALRSKSTSQTNLLCQPRKVDYLTGDCVKMSIDYILTLQKNELSEICYLIFMVELCGNSRTPGSP